MLRGVTLLGAGAGAGAGARAAGHGHLLQIRAHRRHSGSIGRRKSALSKTSLLPSSKNNPKKAIPSKSDRPFLGKNSFWFTDIWCAPKVANLEYVNKTLAKKFTKPKQDISIIYDGGPTEFIKPDEVICIEKVILPESDPSNNPSTKQNKPITSNIISVCNKLGKHQIEIVTPNVKNGILATSHIGVPSVIIRNLKLFPMISNQRATVASNVSDNEPPEDKILKVASGNSDHKVFPSVTKILSQTMSPESRAALEKWKQEKIAELGVEGFENFNKAQLANGARFHNLLSQHLTSPQTIGVIDKPLEGVWSSVSKLLKDINNPKAVESHVIHPVLKYRGIIDCIAMYQDRPTLIEWKKSDKPKATLNATYDNPVQLAAYFGAISHDLNYKTLNVRDALLVIAYTDGSPADVFHLNTEQMRHHWATWLTRLEHYWTANSESSPTEVK